jgi:hypothetical protein
MQQQSAISFTGLTSNETGGLLAALNEVLHQWDYA